MRTIHEVLHPHLLDQRSAFDNQFQGMSDVPFSYEDFQATREKLIETVNSSLSDLDRSFLLSFKRGYPNWDLFPYAKLKDMPAVQWKLLNLQNLIKSNPDKHKELLSKLETFFSKGA